MADTGLCRHGVIVLFPVLPEVSFSCGWEVASLMKRQSTIVHVLIATNAVRPQTAVFDNDLLDSLAIPANKQFRGSRLRSPPTHYPVTRSRLPPLLRPLGLVLPPRRQQSELSCYLGLCHGLVARHGFQDESRWPVSVKVVKLSQVH
jgi:hypothetical protein